jgi:adenosylmethionine-8-amino-7-oxononanoate aminotransferase
MRTTEDVAAGDRRHLWHPFTQQLGWTKDERQVVIDHASGTTLYDSEGNAYIDGVSSLWCNIHGHRHPILDAAIKAQLDKVAHSTMLGLTHEPAVELAERLVAVAPEGLTRVFYSDSGSAAVEIALKLAFQYFTQNGQPRRTKFVSLDDAYHGDTLGAVSVGGIELFHGVYKPLLFPVFRVPSGDAEAMERVLAEHGEEVAGVVIEPLVQAAGGMLMTQEPGYLRAVRELCDRHGVLLIADEIATGFGRTGTMFACQREDVTPDLMCLGKGLTGGYLPLAATLTTERLYEGFLGEAGRTFFHGHTFTGNPLGCAAGIATLRVFEEEGTLEQLPGKVELLADSLRELVEPLPLVDSIRQCGLMVGIDLRGGGAGERRGRAVTLAARPRGAIIRELGDTCVLMPAPAISEPELRRLVEIVAEAIAEVGQRALSVSTAAPVPGSRTE